MIKFDLDIKEETYNQYKSALENIKQEFLSNGKMSDWYYIDKCISKEELEEINDAANYIKNNADLFIIIGIGGSYLGAKALIEALKKESIEIVFAGTTLSSYELSNIINNMKNKKVVINVISKSGTTLETNIVFNLLLAEMNKKYSKEELQTRIIITTDKDDSSLLETQKELNCKLFNVPKNIGGRYSVLTPVGLLPCKVAGINIEELLKGATDASKEEENVFKYTALRDYSYRSNKLIEAFTIYQERLMYFNEWLKQLFAESQGKNKKGILPISILNTRDLHSLGQYMDDGAEIVFETIIYAHELENIYIDGYNKTLDEINYIAMQSVKEAHNHMANSVIELDKIDEYNLGYLIYFFEKACMLGAYLLQVNYYDQDGVNNYKKILLEKLN